MVFLFFPFPALCKPKSIHPFHLGSTPVRCTRPSQEAQSTPPVLPGSAVHPSAPCVPRLPVIARSAATWRSPGQRYAVRPPVGAVLCVAPFSAFLLPLRYAPHPSALRAATFPPGGRLWCTVRPSGHRNPGSSGHCEGTKCPWQ